MLHNTAYKNVGFSGVFLEQNLGFFEKLQWQHCLSVCYDFWTALRCEYSKLVEHRDYHEYEEPTVTKVLIRNGSCPTVRDLHGNTILHTFITLSEDLVSGDSI